MSQSPARTAESLNLTVHLSLNRLHDDIQHLTRDPSLGGQVHDENRLAVRIDLQRADSGPIDLLGRLLRLKAGIQPNMRFIQIKAT